MITIEEAKANVGAGVVYRSAGGDRQEAGVIAGASSLYVFVQYAGERGTKATRPDDLDWEFPGGAS